MSCPHVPDTGRTSTAWKVGTVMGSDADDTTFNRSTDVENIS